MAIYEVYSNPDGKMTPIKRGFSWPGFFFGPWWAFIKGLPLIGILLLIITGSLLSLKAVIAIQRLGLVSELLVHLAFLMLGISVGVQGNNWVRSKVTRRGYSKKFSVKVSGFDAALFHIDELYPQYKNCGAKVLSVAENSQAANAGLLPGDIIVQCNGREIGGEAALQEILASTSDNEKLKMKIRRNNIDIEASARGGILGITFEIVPIQDTSPSGISEE